MAVAQQDKPRYLRDFWRFVKPYKKPLRRVYILYFLNSILNLLPAYSVRYYIDMVLLGNDATLFWMRLPGLPEDAEVNRKIMVSAVFLAAAALLIVVANTIGIIMWREGTKSVERVLFDLKTTLHTHINKLSLGYLHSGRVGDVMTKAVSDVEALNMLMKNSFVLMYQLVQILLAPILMITLSPALFLVAIIPLPLVVYSFYNIRMRLKPMYRRQRQVQSDIASHIQETVSGVREVKAFNIEGRSQEVYADINWRYYDMQNRIMRVFSFNHQLQYGSKDLGIILIAVVGGILMFKGIGGVTVGIIASFIALSQFLFNPIGAFLGFYDIIQRGLASLERVIEFLNVEHDVKDPENARQLRKEEIKGGVEFQNVAFSYEPGQNVLRDINLRVHPGERIAVVGPSGSGKSTLLSLLMRFYNCDQGRILIDGVDIAQCSQSSVRANIGVVFQDTFLFYGSILDNFKYIRPDAPMEEIENACKAANILEDILRLPRGFDTVVGERGVKLSGGQKQRLAIARVFLRDPRIVILDEATSAVDTVTERLIQKSVDSMLRNRSAFIIAHRLGTVRGCDRIIVLANHTIAEQGTHQELMAQKGLYFQFHQQDRLLE